MTRNELKILAEELLKLIKKDKELLSLVQESIADIAKEEAEEYFNTQQAAEFLGVSISYIRHHIEEIPHKKVGRLNKFKKSSLLQYGCRL